jgi:hypothetical protein
MPETHRAIIDTRPAWATGEFAVAVFGGALGCLLLLLKKAGRSLFVNRITSWRDCDYDPYTWHCPFDRRLNALRDCNDGCDAVGGGGVFNLVFETRRAQGLGLLETIGRSVMRARGERVKRQPCRLFRLTRK